MKDKSKARGGLPGDALIQNLKDAGCDQAAIQIFLTDLYSGEPSRGIRLLERHRRSLLDVLHQQQKRIDCLDYLLFMLRKQQRREE